MDICTECFGQLSEALRTNVRKAPDNFYNYLFSLILAFIFSYCTRGMTFVDIAYLKKENIYNGVKCYARRKTGQL